MVTNLILRLKFLVFLLNTCYFLTHAHGDQGLNADGINYKLIKKTQKERK